MSRSPFVSSAPNREDVVLWRALGALGAGRYIDVSGASGPVTRAFEEAGWQAVAPADLGSADEPLHLLRLDADGDEADELTGLALERLRPWVLVVRRSGADRPETPAGYAHCLFDGVSDFFVAEEHAAELGPALSYPACSRDDYTVADPKLLEQVVHWRTTALGAWASAVQQARLDDQEARELTGLRERVEELRARVRRLRARAEEAEQRVGEMESSSSWRVTGPLRAATRSVRRRASR